MKNRTFRFVVFGAGRQGLATVYDLMQRCDADRVVVFDPDSIRLGHAATRLRALLSGDMYDKVIFLATGPSAEYFVAETDVVISCAPHQANIDLTKLALKYHKHFCDLGGNTAIMEEQERLARGARSAVVPACGVSPGISNILAAYLAQEELCNEIRVRCGGNPLIPPNEMVNPYLYSLYFSPDGVASEYTGNVAIIRKGEIALAPALGEVSPFDDEFESAPTANNSPLVAQYLRSLGVMEYDYQTLRYRGHFSAIKKKAPIGDERSLAQWLRDQPELQLSPIAKDRLTLSVRGIYHNRALRETREYRFDVEADPTTGFTAMERMTSWGITLVARYLAEYGGREVHGFFPPEQFMNAQDIIHGICARL
ncbi:MAG: saccharopine dehydrogenase C-terminal domain-containing protein [Patescibacteria group bacterium]